MLHKISIPFAPTAITVSCSEQDLDVVKDTIESCISKAWLSLEPSTASSGADPAESIAHWQGLSQEISKQLFCSRPPSPLSDAVSDEVDSSEHLEHDQNGDLDVSSSFHGTPRFTTWVSEAARSGASATGNNQGVDSFDYLRSDSPPHGGVRVFRPTCKNDKGLDGVHRPISPFDLEGPASGNLASETQSRLPLSSAETGMHVIKARNKSTEEAGISSIAGGTVARLRDFWEHNHSDGL
ncbi:hypothetical protein I302_100865 [Kwoniella bestiolae CBS 10118]|uniref:Uncharacterized protein n=1 Tax=Kwoniella bestiolae CBS 10118 TaxID=1296100 RepID=A0A1B9G6D7_9TREE|nr:hypothetical protein I302_04238 [Kwoniella bestiolae CBS 10118]OCF26552.1 hypothetical protein I302_04238 [Kwoniella bestiolae CBS 10118]